MSVIVIQPPMIEGTDYVWCLNKYDDIDKIKKYELSELFDIGGSRFSDGWGGSWDYADEDRTWSKNPVVLYEKLYDGKRVAANKYSMIENIVDAEIPQPQKDIAIKALLYGFVGTLYGEGYGSGTRLVKLNIDEVHVAFEKDVPMGFIFIRGWPGPDYNLYKFEDFGKTWAFTEEGFAICHE